MHPELDLAVRHAAHFLRDRATRPVSHEPDPRELHARLDKPLTDAGEPTELVLDELVRDATPGLLDSGSGRFFGWVIGGALPVSLAADWLTSTWDQNAGAYACSPAAAVIEDVVGGWLRSLLGLPDDASFAFVTGCQMAHVTALAAARHRVLQTRGWSVEAKGLAGSPPIRVLAGEHHETLLRALRLLGFGTDCVETVDQHDDGTIDVDALASALARGDAPTIVCLAAGDLNRGAFDDFEASIAVAREHGAWVHVDGAFGLWAAASPRFRHLVRGVEGADSWAVDAHKWLNVPYDSGIAFVNDPEAHTTAMAMPAAYVPQIAGTRSQWEWGPEWSRRARGIPMYAALRALGRDGVAALVDRCCDHAAALVDRLGELDGVDVLHRPIINQGLVRFLADDGDHDARTEEVIARINRSGEAWFGPTTFRGMRVMRISVSSHETTDADVTRTVEAVRGALG